MPQLDPSVLKHSNNVRHTSSSPASPAIEQILRGEASKWSPNCSPSCHDMEEDHGYHHKKSVLAKVKEKAKKWKHSLSMKKRHSEDNSTPSWGVSLEEDENEDPEYFGAPMYESVAAPKACKAAAKQHPRVDHVISEKHALSSNVEQHGSQEKLGNSPGSDQAITKNVTENREPTPTPASGTSSEISTKFQDLTVSTQTAQENDRDSTLPVGKLAPIATKNLTSIPSDKAALAPIETSKEVSNLPTDKPAPVETRQQATLETNKQDNPVTPNQASPGKQVWDKGVSVKEFIMNKFEPGDDERALSQVIVEAISPRRNPGEASIVEKVREAVTSLIWSEQSSKRTNVPSVTAANLASNASSSPHVPISTNVHEVVEEENQGRILQAN